MLSDFKRYLYDIMRIVVTIYFEYQFNLWVLSLTYTINTADI